MLDELSPLEPVASVQQVGHVEPQQPPTPSFPTQRESPMRPNNAEGIAQLQLVAASSSRQPSRQEFKFDILRFPKTLEPKINDKKRPKTADKKINPRQYSRGGKAVRATGTPDIKVRSRSHKKKEKSEQRSEQKSPPKAKSKPMVQPPPNSEARKPAKSFNKKEKPQEDSEIIEVKVEEDVPRTKTQTARDVKSKYSPSLLQKYAEAEAERELAREKQIEELRLGAQKIIREQLSQSKQVSPLQQMKREVPIAPLKAFHFPVKPQRNITIPPITEFSMQSNLNNQEHSTQVAKDTTVSMEASNGATRKRSRSKKAKEAGQQLPFNAQEISPISIAQNNVHSNDSKLDTSMKKLTLQLSGVKDFKTDVQNSSRRLDFSKMSIAAGLSSKAVETTRVNEAELTRQKNEKQRKNSSKMKGIRDGIAGLDPNYKIPSPSTKTQVFNGLTCHEIWENVETVCFKWILQSEFKQKLKKTMHYMSIICKVTGPDGVICYSGVNSQDLTERVLHVGDRINLEKGSYVGLENRGSTKCEFECQVSK